MRFNLSGLRPADTTLNGLLWWFLGWIGVPIFVTVIFVFAGRDIGPAWNAAHGEGKRGTLLVQSKECGYHRYVGYRCTGLYGSFTSDDGTVHLGHAFLDAIPKGVGVGDRVATVYEGNRSIVYLATGSHEWLLIAAFLLGGVVALVVWAIRLWGRLASLP